MVDTPDIFTPDPRIAAWHPYWRQNREVIDGARVVKSETVAARYLTHEEGMEPADFKNVVKRAYFYPASSTVHDNLMGLMTRSKPIIKAPDGIKDVLETITAEGFTLEDLDEDLKSERLITNYTGLVTDYPVAPPGMSLAQAINGGFRPLIAMYKAESILGIELGKVGHRKRVVRVRLLEDQDTVRELRLDDGVYSIVMHHRRDGQITVDAPIIPTRQVRGSKPEVLDEIPFTLDSSSRDFLPVNAPLGELVATNIAHYVANSNRANEEYFSTVRIFITKGIKNEVAKTLPAYTGARWNFEDKPEVTDQSILSASDNVISDLRETCHDLERKMVIIGLRMLEADTASNISTETTRIRDNAKNANIAGIIRRGDRSVNDQLEWVSWWMGMEPGSIEYQTPTNFAEALMTREDIEARVTMWEKGVITLETLYKMVSSALPESFDPQIEKDAVAQEIADRPTLELPQDDQEEDDEE